MLITEKIDNPLNLSPEELVRESVSDLTQPERLRQRLAEIDRARSLKRIYVMGCGRSGTWLLTAIMSTMRDTCVVPKELPVENFGLYSCTESTLVLKRNFRAYEKIEQIPDLIQIAYIVRHPYDVLTSTNPLRGPDYHITPSRWLGEMLALQFLVDSNRPKTLIVRYEDLVSGPDVVQKRIAEFFGLKIAASTEELENTFKASPEAVVAMNGLRKIDTDSINKFLRDPEKLEYLRQIKPRLARMLEWVAAEYGYDVSAV